MKLRCALLMVAVCTTGSARAQEDAMKAAREFLLAPARPAECQENDERVQVMVLGSYHMANPGADVFNMDSDDVFAPARQEQVAAVVERLAYFGPTKIALESAYGGAALGKAYAEYLAERSQLTRSEEQQVGFRLARRLGHDSVYGVDAEGDFDLSGIQAIAMADPEQGALLASMQVFGGAAVALMGEWLAEGTVSEMLRRMNERAFLLRAHQLYIDVLGRFVAGEDYAGPDLVGDWYTRNLRIFANIGRISDPGDRVLVLFGQGHAPILRDLVSISEPMCLVEPGDYLP